MARNAGAKEVHCLHLLVALTRLGASRAMQALQACGHEAAPLRNAAVGWLTGTAPRRFVRPGAQGAAARREGAPRAAGVAGALLWTFVPDPRENECTYDIGPDDPAWRVVTDTALTGHPTP